LYSSIERYSTFRADSLYLVRKHEEINHHVVDSMLVQQQEEEDRTRDGQEQAVSLGRMQFCAVQFSATDPLALTPSTW
jgi:hypothetical protein